MTKPVPENADLSQAERIDQVCTGFEAAWKKEETPRLEDWLREVPGAERQALLQELLLVEIHYRRRGGVALDAAEYRQRFPELDKAWLRGMIPSPHETAAYEGNATPIPGDAAAQPVQETIRFSSAYELQEEIGRGGMGVVYRGHDADLNRTLAVKVLLPKHGDNEELKRRFLEEAQIMGQLQHPGVAPIHEIGRLADGRPFFSMKQIKGQTLTELLKNRGAGEKAVSEVASAPRDDEPRATERGTLTQPRSPEQLPRLLNIFEQICQTVAFAHSRGILHRDLKPGNVMVGAFGEVQVMDWGLAKTLSAVSNGRPPANPASQQPSTIFLTRASSPNSSDTAAGHVLGTPAYMAPVQARGEVEQLDERCDVFGLGALLCEILTGQPPFPGDTQIDSHRKAVNSDLHETFARLKTCGADPELVQLARHCLAVDKADRPRDAAEVAKAVAQYQAGVQERLQQAGIDRAEAQVKVAEERKRRRVWVGLAGLAVVFTVALATAGVWYYYEQAERAQEHGRKAQQKETLEQNIKEVFVATGAHRDGLHRQLADPLKASRLLSDMDGWKAQVEKVHDSWKRAKFLADSGKGLLEDSWFAKLERLKQQIEAEENDWQKAKELDDLRLKADTLVDGKWDAAIAHKLYPSLFLKLGLDLEKEDEAQLAEQIKKSPIRYALVAAMDHWASMTPSWPNKTNAHNKELFVLLLSLARQADPDPWRDQVRDEKVWQHPAKKLQLAKAIKPNEQAPQIILLLAMTLDDPAKRVTLLHKALLHYPKDFWLHVQLSNLVGDSKEKIGCLRAALALRPQSAPTHLNLGQALLEQKPKDVEGAIGHFEKAIELDEYFVMAHNNLGNALVAKKELDRAIWHFEKAIELDKNYAWAHNNLGLALVAKKDLNGAIKHYHKAIELEPNYAVAHRNLGIALFEKKDLDGAIDHYRKAINIDEKYAQAHCNLGFALHTKDDLDGAIKHYHKAIEHDPDYVHAHCNLGAALYDNKNLDAANRVRPGDCCRAVGQGFSIDFWRDG